MYFLLNIHDSLNSEEMQEIKADAEKAFKELERKVNDWKKKK